jgi:hypothetical protein
MVRLATSPNARDGHSLHSLRHSASTQLLPTSASCDDTTSMASEEAASATKPEKPRPRYVMPRPPPPPSASCRGVKPPAEMLAAVMLLEMLPPSLYMCSPHSCYPPAAPLSRC